MRKRKILTIILVMCFSMLATFAFGEKATVEKTYNFVFLSHGGEENPAWGLIYRGMEDAAKTLGVSCVMYRPTTEGDLAMQLANFKTALAQNPDGIITSIPHPTMFNDVIQQALDKGIPVIVANTDGLIGTGSPLEKKLNFVGQDLEPAAYLLAKEASKYFPPRDQAQIVVGIGGPGLSWAEQRSSGITRYLKESGYTNYKRLDTSMAMDTAESRITAYLKANPKTNVMFFVGGVDIAAAASSARNLGYKPGQIVIAGFDILPQTLTEIKNGYINVVIDQQLYLQGAIPVMELYLVKKYGFSTWDANTGHAFVDKSNVDKIIEYSKVRAIQ
jgi:simple sugar transport system substrate-binding protein